MPGKLKLRVIGMYTTDRFMRVILLRGAYSASLKAITARQLQARVRRRSQAPLFLSSHTFGSQSSILLSSGSMIHANLPFSCDSGPWMIATPPARDRTSTRLNSSHGYHLVGRLLLEKKKIQSKSPYLH